jgi:S-(hydroxymethyl)glutathione dehydrogenase/alcohol dehydrogenase
VEDYLGKKVKVDEFVSHTFTLTDINQAFDVMHQGKRYVETTVCVLHVG